MAQLNVVAQGDKAGGHRPVGDKVNSQRVGPIQPSVQRVARPPEARKDASRRAEQPPASRVTRFNAPAPDSPTAPPFPQGSWMRTLVIGLILAALVPNITLAVVLWLGLIDPPWTKQEVPPQAAAQPATPTAVLTAPATLEATAGEYDWLSDRSRWDRRRSRSQHHRHKGTACRKHPVRRAALWGQ